MVKTILITGATDGIGLETVKQLATQGHRLLIHGRSADKLAKTQQLLAQLPGAGVIETYQADLSQLDQVEALATNVAGKHEKLDVLINNAGVFAIPEPRTSEGYDLRFIVNTLAPYVLTKRLVRLMPADGRVINLSSAAQWPVSLKALNGKVSLDDNQAYGQSKLALTMWSFYHAAASAKNGPSIIAINPASFLGSKMVKEAYGVAGNDLSVGADILVRAALSDEFADANGKYYDNDHQRFAAPHSDALDEEKNRAVVDAIEALIAAI